MEYKVILSDKSYDLPQYNVKISEKLEQVEKTNTSGCAIKEKLKKMHSLAVDLLGKENANEALGKFEDADPNMINVAYLSIVEAYNKPLEDFEMELNAEKLNSEVFDTFKDILSNLKEVSALAEKK